MVRTNRWTSLAQNSDEVTTGFNRKVSKHTVHLFVAHRIAYLETSQWGHADPCPLPKALTMSIRTGSQSARRMSPDFDEWCFLLHHMDEWLNVCAWASWGTHRLAMRYGDASKALLNLGPYHLCWCYLDMYHPVGTKHDWMSCPAFYGDYFRVLAPCLQEQSIKRWLRNHNGAPYQAVAAVAQGHLYSFWAVASSLIEH